MEIECCGELRREGVGEIGGSEHQRVGGGDGYTPHKHFYSLLINPLHHLPYYNENDANILYSIWRNVLVDRILELDDKINSLVPSEQLTNRAKMLYDRRNQNRVFLEILETGHRPQLKWIDIDNEYNDE
jgi:hypothetical protein